MELKKELIERFRSLKWDLEDFVAKRQLTAGEEARFFSALLYGIYYREMMMDVLPHQKGANPWLFWTFLAETLPQNRLEQLLSSLPDEEALYLAALCSYYPREGAWAIVQGLKKRASLQGTQTPREQPHFPSAGLRQGYDRIVYALATRGDHLERQPWLISLVESLKEFLQQVGGEANPIILFDQSAPAQWKKNRQWTEKLSQDSGVPILHLSSRQTLSYAKKLGVDQWIRTQAGRAFGYGGARNAVFFLAPVLFEAAKKNQWNSAALKTFFQEAVLGARHHDLMIHLGEDDVVLPASQVFSDAQFALGHQDLYFSRSLQAIGRRTMQVNPLMDLKSLLEDPSRLYSSTAWTSTPEPAGMKGMLTKPRFCLPLPFGNEESHALPPHIFKEDSQPPLIHLGGTRFPHKLWPKSPLDGILAYLKRYIPYSFQISMVSQLLDPANKRGKTVFPWNEEKNSHSLGDLLKEAASPAVQKQMQERFWRNFQEAFIDPDNLFLRCLRGYADYDPALKAPKSFKNYYVKLQKEAECTLAFAEEIIRRKKRHESIDYDTLLKQCSAQCQIAKPAAGFAEDLLLLIQCIHSFPADPIQRTKSY